MMGYSVWKIRVLLACMVALLGASCSKKELEPTPPEPERPAVVARPVLQFETVRGASEDVQEAKLTTLLLPQLHSRLEIRTVVVPAGKPVVLPAPYEGVLELRAGSLSTGVEGNRQVRQRGDMWQVAKGERMTLEASGELAVVRAIYLVPSEK